VKIGLYVQDNRTSTNVEFDNAIRLVKKAGLDLLVFPEVCYAPYEFAADDIMNFSDRSEAFKLSLEISKAAGCAVILGYIDRTDMIYNVYANAFAVGEETTTAVYLKHTMTDKSPLDFPDYADKIESLFPIIILKDKRIGMTICYDCNHAAISRAYHKKGIDILVNSTGGNVVYAKWYRYNKVRAVENECFGFCTMGYEDDGRENAYAFAFTPKGKLIRSYFLMQGGVIGNIAVYDTALAPDGFDDDINLNQTGTLNKYSHYTLDVSTIDAILASSSKICSNLWVLPIGKYNLVFCCIDKDDILKPEKVLQLLYHEKLRSLPQKKYLIINQCPQVKEILDLLSKYAQK